MESNKSIDIFTQIKIAHAIENDSSIKGYLKILEDYIRTKTNVYTLDLNTFEFKPSESEYEKKLFEKVNELISCRVGEIKGFYLR